MSPLSINQAVLEEKETSLHQAIFFKGRKMLPSNNKILYFEETVVLCYNSLFFNHSFKLYFLFFTCNYKTENFTKLYQTVDSRFARKTFRKAKIKRYR